MKYTMLLWPHANARYQQEARRLAAAELRAMLDRFMPEASIREADDLPGLTIECESPLDSGAIDALRGHSLMYELFEHRPDGALTPIAGRAGALLGEDLPAILKYKGKTNEMFLQFLINLALYASDYWNGKAKLSFFDPMCGRATAPFIALNRGWNATGADVDQEDLRQAEQFFKRYLEYHRFKHQFTRGARTLPGGRSAPVAAFSVGVTPERFKAGDTVSLSLARVDAAFSGHAFADGSFHIIACDLPYGVRHDAVPGGGVAKGANWLEALLKKALPQWRGLLKPGGGIALSFNAQTFRRDRLRGLLADAGFEVLASDMYDSLEHWVEQAITRDVAVARKPR